MQVCRPARPIFSTGIAYSSFGQSLALPTILLCLHSYRAGPNISILLIHQYCDLWLDPAWDFGYGNMIHNTILVLVLLAKINCRKDVSGHWCESQSMKNTTLETLSRLLCTASCSGIRVRASHIHAIILLFYTCVTHIGLVSVKTTIWCILRLYSVCS